MVSEIRCGDRHGVLAKVGQRREKAVRLDVVLKNRLHVAGKLVDDKEIAEHTASVNDDDCPNARRADD